jgi:hypothetical protein
MERRSSGSTIRTNHVNQGNSEVGGVSSDDIPSDTLTPLAGVPGGTFGGGGDGYSPRGGYKEGCGEDGEGTHYRLG